jgi:hypothetical protein
MVGEALVFSGLARIATFPPDVKYVDTRLLPAQAKARSEHAGMWIDAVDEPSPPAGGGPPPACSAPGKNSCNCADFSTRAAAQAFHAAYDPADTNKLDTNGDVVVCESLP